MLQGSTAHPGRGGSPARSIGVPRLGRVGRAHPSHSTRLSAAHRALSVLLFLLMASLDNTVLAMLPASFPLIAADLRVDEAAIGAVIGISLLVVALAAVVWGYLSDRADRRTLLIFGTLGWVAPVGLLSSGGGYTALLMLFPLAGVGLGCVATVGYSIITDLVGPGRRGLMLSLWGGTQGVGAGLGAVLVAALGPLGSWRLPFGALAACAALLAVLSLLAASPRKGGADPELRRLREQGGEYGYRISREDVRRLLRRPGMRLLMSQGFVAQLAYGALQWLPALLTAKLLAEGVPAGTAASAGALLFLLTQAGAVFGMLWGHLGDRLQARDLRARPLLSALGLWVSVPAYLLVFWLPLPLGVESGSGGGWALAGELGRNGRLWLMLGASLVATAANAANSPNWFALVSELNLPEHRGTAYSLVGLANNAGRALSGGATGVVLTLLGGGALLPNRPDTGALAPPEVYAAGLSVFVLCCIPAGFCFLRMAACAPGEIRAARATLRSRAAARAPTG